MAKTKEIKCKICKKPKTVRVADLKRGWGKTCSKSCAARLNNLKTGNFSRYLQRKKDKGEQELEGPTFSNAHQFSNEEYFKDKD